VDNFDNSWVSMFDVSTVHMKDVAERFLTNRFHTLAFVVTGLSVHLRM
jgi:hypothetical protein